MFQLKKPKTAFVCSRCDGVFRGEPFLSWTGGGVIIMTNSKDLCCHCAATISIEEANAILRQKNQVSGS